MTRPGLKEAILDAAESIVIESGASHMTLDAVAERSGISKGGLMYHFPSKEALLEAMVERMEERFAQLRINEQTGEPAEDIAARVLREGRVVALANHTALVTRDGREVPIEDSAAPIRDAGGGVGGVMHVFHDVAAKRRAQEELRKSEAQLRTVIENLTEGLVVSDLEGNLLHWNRAALEMHGFASEEECRRHLSEFTRIFQISDMEGNVLPAEQWPLARILRGETLRGLDVRVLRLAGGWQGVFSYAGALVRDEEDRPLLGLVTLTDITERKRNEDELRQANAALAEADRRKDEFLAMLAHELRNPLAPVRNAVAVLRLAGPNESILQRQLNIIDRQVTHMARLLDDLLNVSRITCGMITLQKQPLALLEVLAHAAEVAAPLVEARRHTLHRNLPPADLRVDGDLDRLAQVVGNMLTNAAKYTPEGGQIWLESAHEDGWAVVRVRDIGVGIAPEMLPRVFELFAQADRSMDRSQGGLGIGLTMAQSLVEMHGGRVEVRSDGPGRGSEFTVYLPALPEGAADIVPSNESPLASGMACVARRRILVVDDVVDSAETLADLLRLWGHEVATAHDGPAAVEATRHFHPEAVLLDIGLPGMNGLEVARRLRAEHDRPMLIIALSGYGQAQDQAESLAAGFDRHLVKPVDLQALEKLLASLS